MGRYAHRWQVGRWPRPQRTKYKNLAKLGKDSVMSTLSAPSNRKEAVREEMICAKRRFKFVYVGLSMSKLRRQISYQCWVLVSEPGFFLVFGSFPWKSNFFTRNEAQEQQPLRNHSAFVLSLGAQPRILAGIPEP